MSYDVRQFRPTIYLLILMGMLGYAMAAQSFAFLVVGVVGVLTNAWISFRGRFRPLPRPIANLVTLAAVAYIIHELVTQAGPPVMIVGQFLVFLQLVKLWEQRGNRDWAQLLVLSLLLMVAALMNTASLWFGLLLAAYLCLSLYCCLLFHLKVEADLATAAFPVSPDKLSPETLRQDQRFLGKSMRRLTVAIAGVGIVFAVGIFVIFPRGPGGVLGPLQQFHNPLTGFSDRVSFQSVAAIQQSHERVAFVKLWHNDRLIQGTETLMLRGLTLDRYARPFPRPGGSWDWTHSPPPPALAQRLFPGQAFPDIWGPAEEAKFRQQITLWPTNTRVLFALAGARQFTPQSGEVTVSYTPEDGALMTMAPLKDRLEYEVLSTGSPERLRFIRWSGPQAVRLRQDFPEIFNYARRPDVCGADANGISLGDTRVGMAASTTDLDARIASNIEHYLQNNFTYTLDLTNAESLEGREPLSMFLQTWKRGHCEYFAGAMTLMCQTLGLQARMVIGFKVGPENYNDFTQSYTVYDSDAHAWVEINTPNGWQTFDPTSSRSAASPKTGWAAAWKHLLEYFEFKYANAVIAYDAQTRLGLISSIENAVNSAVNRLLDLFAALADTSTLTFTSIGVLVALLVATLVGWYVWGRLRLLRRAQRIGIESLPATQQLHLARQLGFYDDLVRMLEQHDIVRPPHFTPLEFGRSLSFLPAALYDRILRLTHLFYAVRYGGVELSPARQKHLANTLTRLSDQLKTSPPET
jgi:transglutaminase-like putative cysteine protease